MDPGAEKKAARAFAAIPANDLIEDVAARFNSHYAKRHLKAGTAHEVERPLQKEIVGPLAGRRLSQIGRADIHEILDDIVACGSRPSPRTGRWHGCVAFRLGHSSAD